MIVSILDKSGGFYSMFHFTLNHLLFCKKNNISFQIDSTNWLFKYKDGWTDYFKYFELKGNNYHPVRCIKHYQTAGDFPLYEYVNIIKEIYVYNDTVLSEIENVKQFFHLQKSAYDSIFIRRGDKLIGESIYIPVEKYMDLLLQINPDCHTPNNQQNSDRIEP